MRARNAPRVLLVDDDEYVHRIVRRTLAFVPAEVETTESGAAAIEAAREKRYDLVLLDLGLPDTDGWTVLEELRRIPAYHATPVVVVSGLIGHPAGRAATVAAFLAKPIRATVLLGVVRDLLRGRARPEGGALSA